MDSNSFLDTHTHTQWCPINHFSIIRAISPTHMFVEGSIRALGIKLGAIMFRSPLKPLNNRKIEIKVQILKSLIKIIQNRIWVVTGGKIREISSSRLKKMWWREIRVRVLSVLTTISINKPHVYVFIILILIFNF